MKATTMNLITNMSRSSKRFLNTTVSSWPPAAAIISSETTNCTETNPRYSTCRHSSAHCSLILNKSFATSPRHIIAREEE